MIILPTIAKSEKVMSVLEDVKNAFKNLGGVAMLPDVFDEYSKMHADPKYPTVRAAIYTHSSNSKAFKNKGDYFWSVDGIRQGKWGLRDFVAPLEPLIPEGNISPDHQRVEINRIMRDTTLAREIKNLVGNHCQLCDVTIVLPNGKSYCEAHHIMPLGLPYNGPDIQENIIILCPNCHVKCDYRIISLELSQVRDNYQGIGERFLSFHNELHAILVQE